MILLTILLVFLVLVGVTVLFRILFGSRRQRKPNHLSTR
jgi:hypothetical protein